MPPRKKRALELKPGDDVSAVAQTVQKKENGRRNVRGKRGGLKDMLSMPLDVLMEILCLLEPRDLLNLARTSKPFRDLLMTRKSASIWKSARENVDGFPDRPAHLSEPAYAFLAFFPYCHSCLKPNVQTILWEFSKRYCRSCLQTNTISAKASTYPDKHDWALRYFDDGILARVTVNARTEIYHRPELDEIKPVVEKLRSDPKAWDAYKKEQRVRLRAINDHAALCHEWSQRRAANRSAELQDTRQQRLASIVEKLRELGWGDELDRLACLEFHPLCNHAHVKLSKPLTNRGWLKIKDDLVIMMEEVKRKRLRIERTDMLLERLRLFKSVVTAARAAPPKLVPADELKPRCRDLAMMPEVRRALEVPNDVAVTEQTLQVFVSMLPALEERWQRERTAELVQMLHGSGVEAQDGVELLDLAATVFKCTDCGRFLHHPRVLMHECPSGLKALYDKATYQYITYYRCVYEVCGQRHPWVQSTFCVAPGLDRVRTLIALCEKDAGVATQGNMDDTGLKLVHDDPNYGASVMSWRRAIKEIHTGVQYDIGHWRVASEADNAAIKAREDEQRQKQRRTNMQSANYRCAYCGISRMELGANVFVSHMLEVLGGAPFKLVSHIKTEHGIEQPALENGDYYLHPDDDESELEPIQIQERRALPMGLSLDYDYDDGFSGRRGYRSRYGLGGPYDYDFDEGYGYDSDEPYGFDNPYDSDDFGF